MRFYFDRFILRDWLQKAVPVAAIAAVLASAAFAYRSATHRPPAPPFPLVCRCTDRTSCTVEAGARLPPSDEYSRVELRDKNGNVYLATCHSGEVVLSMPDGSHQMTAQPAGLRTTI
jgi:hypothetical protein